MFINLGLLETIGGQEREGASAWGVEGFTSQPPTLANRPLTPHQNFGEN